MRLLPALALFVALLCAGCEEDDSAVPPRAGAGASQPSIVAPVPPTTLAVLDRSGVEVSLSDEDAAVDAAEAVAEIRARRPAVASSAQRITASLGRVSSEADLSSNRPKIDDELVWVIALHDVPGAAISCRIDDPTCQETSGKNTVVAFISSTEPAHLVVEDFFNPSHQR